MKETIYYPLSPEEDKKKDIDRVISATESAKAFIFRERREFAMKAMEQHPISRDSSLNLVEIRKIIQQKHGLRDGFELDMTNEDHQGMVEEAISEINSREISKSAEMHQKETGATNQEVISVMEKYLKALADSAYDMSYLFVVDGARKEDFSEYDKIVLVEASKNLARLIKLTNFDNQVSIAVKRFFVKLLFQNMNLHKNWNGNMRGIEKFDDRRYRIEEKRLKDGVTDQLISQFMGTVDMELAALLALQRNPLIKKGSADLADPEEDFLIGADLVFKLDSNMLGIERWDDSSEPKSQSSELEDREILMRYLSKEEFGVQVKSHFVKEDLYGGMKVRLRIEKRPDGHLYKNQEEKCIIWLDVFYDSTVIEHGNVSAGSDQVRIFQLDFNAARDAELENFDQLLEIIKREYEKIHINRQAERKGKKNVNQNVGSYPKDKRRVT